MPERRVVIGSKVGLHARPAAMFVQAAAKQPVKVTIAKAGGDPVDARVVGQVVLPTVGQVLSDRTGLGIGAFLVVPDDVMNPETTTFVGIRLRAGAAPRTTLAALRERLGAWDVTGSPAQTYPTPVRPPEIVILELRSDRAASRGSPRA